MIGSSLTQHLDALVAHLEQRGQSVRPSAFVADFPVAVTPALRGLYERCGASERVELLPGLRLLSPADAVAEYERRRHSDRWDHRWLPLLTSGDGGVVAVECRGAVDEVLLVDECGSFSRERVTLVEWIAGLVASYDAGLLDDDPPQLPF